MCDKNCDSRYLRILEDDYRESKKDYRELEHNLKNKPIIHTVDGNRYTDELRVETRWIVEPGKFVKLIEQYIDIETGRVVRESAHVLSLRDMMAETYANLI